MPLLVSVVSMRLSRQQIEAIYHQGPDAIVSLVERLQEGLDQLQLYVRALEKRLEDVEKCPPSNSGNSSRPPSSDWVRKPPPARSPSGKPKGGQPGHEGHTLEMAGEPDVVVVHAPAHCALCGLDLSQAEVHAELRRQVFDLPPVALEVTEHRAQQKRCAFCGTTTWGTFPQQVQAPVQYGARLRALVLYLNAYQLVPFERLSQLIFDLTGHALSTGTLAQIVEQAGDGLSAPCHEIQAQVARSAIVHGDETGVYVAGQLFWMHVASTAKETFYAVTKKRGKAGMDAAGVLPDVRGTMVHDGLESYQHYTECAHALCNAHHLRELRALEEQGIKWAKRMKGLLLQMKQAVDEARARGEDRPPAEVVATFVERYDREVEQAWKDVGPPAKEMVRRQMKDGSVLIEFREVRKKSKSYNLLLRLSERREQVLRFLTEAWVPFDNNQAERDLRMAKLKQKISGCFRSEAGAAAFCRLRSYVSTMRKQGQAVLAALQAAIEGEPLSCAPC
jgi:transposase